MDKLKMHTPDKTDENIEKIAALFPNAVTEVIKGYRDDGSAIVEHAIDFDVLRQELSHVVVEGPQERYQFTWPDKRKSILLANQPIAKTMRPCREESVDFDTTENLYIEGDNLDALKLLQETYLGKVKMIYIDPPYNTGKDFVYKDNFSQGLDAYLVGSGQLDEEGSRLVANIESNGRFHTNWLNMIYPRLKLVKDLLSDDGSIFISIDDNEFASLKLICDEIFGIANFITDIAWRSADSSNNDAKQFSADYNHTLIYSRNPGWQPLRIPRNDENNKHYKNPDNDPNGPWFSGNVSSPNPRENLKFDIISPNGTKINAPANGWRWKKERMNDMISSGEIIFSADQARIIKKTYLKDQAGIVPSNIWWDVEETGHNRNAKYELIKIFSELNTSDIFKTPKPTKFLDRIVQLASERDSIIMDFFSGSATTAHSVIKANLSDQGNRKFIMVQLPETCEVSGNGAETSLWNICEIGKERIRRAGRKIKEEAGLMAQDLDIGFRVLKIDSTNMRKVKHNPTEIKQDQIGMFTDNIKPDRTGEDLLFQVMLDLGILLSSKIEEKDIDGKHVFSVANDYLIACFDSNVTTETVTKIAKIKPYYAVFRDSSMANDSVATNFEQIFVTYSPTTVRKVL